MSKEIIVVSYPTEQSKIIIVDTNSSSIINRLFCWMYQIEENILDKLDKFPEIKKITFFGPFNYLKPLMDKISEETSLEVVFGESTKEKEEDIND